MKQVLNMPIRIRHATISLAILGTFASSTSLAQFDPEQTVGRASNGTVVLSTNQIIKPAGTQIEFRGRPNAVSLSPDNKNAAFLTGAYKAIIVIDMASNTVKQEFDAAGSSASFDGLVYSKDGRKLYASQANGRIIVANVDEDGMLSLERTITLPKTNGNPYPGDLALSDDGKTLYVALSRNNSLGAIDLASGTLSKEIPVGNAPHGIVISGNLAYVSNRGGRPAEIGEFTNNSSGTAIVADPTSGFATTGTVSVVDLNTGVQVKSIEVGLHPTALLLNERRLFVTNTGSDSVSVIDTQSQQVMQTIHVRPFPGAPLGSSPNALAIIDGKQLAVSLGRNNALAIYRMPKRFLGAFAFQGVIPTGWYPGSIAVDEKNRRLVVANDKGVGSLGPDAKVGPDPATNKTGKWVHSNLGSTSIINFPTESELNVYTAQVYKNNSWNLLADQMQGRSLKQLRQFSRMKPLPVPEVTGAPSVFKHVFYIVKENRTYDQVFGDMPQGNGDPNLVQFGREVTPNHHALAEQFVLLDNLYDSGSNSADGHQWATQAFVTDYLEKAYGGFTRSYPFNGGDALAYPQTGFLWDNAIKHGKSFRAYGEYANGLLANGEKLGSTALWKNYYNDALILAGKKSGALHADLEASSDVPSLDKNLNRDFPPYTMLIPDQYRVEVFLKEFKQYVKNGNLPNLVTMQLTNDHTAGTRANYPTPRAMVADNDLALGRVVEAISNSPYWKDSVIFVIEDDAQNGVDHVDGHRTIGFVISPYTKRQTVDSRYYTQINMVRTMEQILGLPPMNQMDLAVDPLSMKSLFTRKPDFTPFEAVPNLIALDEMNPGSTEVAGLRKEWMLASGALDFSKPDAADEQLLNRAIWYSTRGFNKPYPGDARVLAPREVHSYLGSKQALVSRN